MSAALIAKSPTNTYDPIFQTNGGMHTNNYIYDTGTLSWIADTGATGVGGGGGLQYADGAARLTATGTLAMGDDGTNIQSVKVDSNGVLAVQDNGGSITVDGTFWQATQPVSIAATVTVSGPLTDTQLRATPVPVSGTVTATTGGLTDTQLRATPVPVSGTVTANAGTGPWPVTDNAGSLTVDQATGTNLHMVVDSGTITTVSTVTAVTAISNALPAGNNNIGDIDIASIAAGNNNIGDVDVASIAAGTNRIGSVRLVDSADADLTSAVSTQTSRFVGVQRSIDAGRTEVRFYAVAAAAGTTTTETAITLTRSSGTAATSTGTSFVLTTGKRLRITHISIATRGNATATIQSTTFNFRINTAGAVGTTSTPVILSARSATPATASAWDRYMIDLGEGMEILGNGTIQFGVTAAATYTTNAPTWDVTIIGYEY